MLVVPAKVCMLESSLMLKVYINMRLIVVVTSECWVTDRALPCTGSPSIIYVLFDRNSTTLTCMSTGGPPTTVTWMKDGVPVNVSLYEQSQRVVDTENATYENVLFSDNVANFIGTFTCMCYELFITCAVPAPPAIQITQSSASSVARQSLTLNCSATVQEGIMGSLTLAWSRDDVELAVGAGSCSLSLLHLCPSCH